MLTHLPLSLQSHGHKDKLPSVDSEPSNGWLTLGVSDTCWSCLGKHPPRPTTPLGVPLIFQWGIFLRLTFILLEIVSHYTTQAGPELLTFCLSLSRVGIADTGCLPDSAGHPSGLSESLGFLPAYLDGAFESGKLWVLEPRDTLGGGSWTWI